MDPNATIRNIREIQARMAERDDARERAEADGTMDYSRYDELQSLDHESLCDAYEALDEWLTNGGFLPDVWKR